MKYNNVLQILYNTKTWIFELNNFTLKQGLIKDPAKNLR